MTSPNPRGWTGERVQSQRLDWRASPIPEVGLASESSSMTSRTRSGTNFKNTNETTARSTEHGSTEMYMSETSELAGMLKALLDDRKALETELREERRIRVEEMATRRREQRQTRGVGH